MPRAVSAVVAVSDTHASDNSWQDKLCGQHLGSQPCSSGRRRDEKHSGLSNSEKVRGWKKCKFVAADSAWRVHAPSPAAGGVTLRALKTAPSSRFAGGSVMSACKHALVLSSYPSKASFTAVPRHLRCILPLQTSPSQADLDDGVDVRQDSLGRSGGLIPAAHHKHARDTRAYIIT